MDSFNYLIEKWLAPVSIIFSAFIFALAPLIMLVNREVVFTRKLAIRYTVQTLWLMFANTLIGLTVYPWAIQRFDKALGTIVNVILTMFGGTIALGIYQYIFNNRTKIGKSLVGTQVKVESEDTNASE